MISNHNRSQEQRSGEDKSSTMILLMLLIRIMSKIKSKRRSVALVLLLTGAVGLAATETNRAARGTWPQEYSIQRNDEAGYLTLSTPYYTVRHNLNHGGAVDVIRLTHGKATNLLVKAFETLIIDDQGNRFTDINDAHAEVSHRREGLVEIVTVDAALADEAHHSTGIRVKTTVEYHWGYLKIHKEFRAVEGVEKVREICPVTAVLSPTLTDYGYREGTTEQEGAGAFSFGSCIWGNVRGENLTGAGVAVRYVPRYVMLADAGVEGLEWFVGSDLSQWDLQMTGRRGEGQCVITRSQNPPGILFSVSAVRRQEAVALPNGCAFDFYLGIPILEGNAQKPWLHTSFNRNRGEWVSSGQIQQWATSGIQTVHCHNDGDYYEDGLFWRDGSYPPYPDMERFDRVIKECRRVGIRTATYFSNKELHPSTPEFQQHSGEWGRKDAKGNIQHNFFKGTNEFGAQMCLRSGWLDYLKLSIDRVLKNHPLDGVYYDWNVALNCANGLHEGKKKGDVGAGHWDIDELLDLMEWTRKRVGPDGVVIVHNTTTPMFCTENFAGFVVANEWGYGKWKDNGPELKELPLEWSLVGARPRGVISYGQIDARAPKRLHQVFALEALLSGVTPWPASTETIELYPVLKALGDLETYRFADWRDGAVSLGGTRTASAIYSRPNESYVLIGNLAKEPRTVQCALHAEKLPYPLRSIHSATIVGQAGASAKGTDDPASKELAVRQLTGDGVGIRVPGDSVVLVRIR